MSIFVLNGKWVIHWRWLLQCTLCTWCESGVWWPSLGCPQVFNRVKAGLTSGQGFTFASLCSRKSLVYFAVCTQVLSCLISGFGVGGKRWHKKRLKNIVNILGSYYTIASTWTNMSKHSEVKLNSPMQCCLVLPRNPFLPYNHRNSVLIVCTKLSQRMKNRHS